MLDEKTKILVVDDEPEIVDILSNFLSRKGHEVRGAFSAEEALIILKKRKTDLILLDIRLPGMQGTELAKIIKEKYPSTQILVVTAYPGEIKSFCKDNILAGLLAKPVQLQDLYNKLLEIFGQNKDALLSLELGQGIKKQALLDRARMLFLEQSLEIYNFLSAHFRKLFHNQESCQFDVAEDEEKAMGKLALLNTDILVINASFFKGYNMNFLSKILERNLFPKEIIVYNIEDVNILAKTELERLKKAVLSACLKNGLIEPNCQKLDN